MMSVEDTSEAFPDLEPSRKPAPRKRTLLVVSADEDCISRSLLHAVQHEFPWLSVVHAGSVQDAAIFDGPAATLVLIDMSLFDELRSGSAALLARHPKAPIALLQLGEVSSVDPSDVLSCRFIRSVLPMNLRLDVWLAAVKLILLGGEYYPFELLKTVVALRGAGEPRRIAPSEGEPAPTAGQRPLEALTAREMQILELVARGLQNKLIASALRLSEHTVKIHLHNIINKLGVHNRTEAAGLFFDSKALLSSLSEARLRATAADRT